MLVNYDPIPFHNVTMFVADVSLNCILSEQALMNGLKMHFHADIQGCFILQSPRRR